MNQTAQFLLETLEKALPLLRQISAAEASVNPFTLGFIRADYREHLNHHLNQIMPESGFKSNFENLY